MAIQPYLYFGGRCEEAAQFYVQALGAKVEVLMRFKDAPEGMPMPGVDPDKVMHMSLKIGDATVLASDGQCAPSQFDGFSLCLNVADVEEANRTYAALAEGGVERMPLGETFFSTRFGMLVDRFGVPWIVIAPPPASFRPGAQARSTETV